MRTLDETAAKIFQHLVKELAPGEARRIGKAGAGFMPVSIDYLYRNRDGSSVYAVAHRYEMNGDLVPDPDVEFYVSALGIAPTAMDQALGYQRAIDFKDSRPIVTNERAQASIAAFCNMWMRNIRDQQELVVS